MNSPDERAAVEMAERLRIKFPGMGEMYTMEEVATFILAEISAQKERDAVIAETYGSNYYLSMENKRDKMLACQHIEGIASAIRSATKGDAGG